MYTAMIVEDEYKIYQLISRLVPWAELGIELVGYCENGISALEMFREKQIDIVITDIRMPGMDGIELIRKAREMNNSAFFIIISGYREFEYAHSAMHYGIEEYLLKPIDQQELINALTRVTKRLEQSEVDRQEESKLDMARKMLRQSFMDRLLSNDPVLGISEETLREQYNLPFRCSTYQMFFVCLYGISPDDGTAILSTIASHLPAFGNNSDWDCLPAIQNDTIRMALLVNYMPDQDPTNDLLRKLTAELKTVNVPTMRYVIGAGEAQNNITGLKRSMRTAELACLSRFCRGADAVYYYDPGTYGQTSETAIDPYVFSKLENSAEYLNADEVLEYYDILAERIDTETSPAAISELFVRVKEAVLSVYQTYCSEQEMENEKLTIEEQLCRALDLQEASQAMKRWISRIIDTCVSFRKQTGNHYIRSAKQYIMEHYMEDLTMSEVADQLHLNPSYFSGLFKKETGYNFLEYLTDYRIDMAKQLLKNSQESVANICSAVGYSDVKYFYKLFKKKVGVKPLAYRKMVN